MLDDLLEPAVATAMQRDLLDHWGWTFKDWSSDHLRNGKIDIPSVVELGIALRDRLEPVIDRPRLAVCWALMYRRDAVGKPHRDAGGTVLSLWLTPDRFNRTPGGGGLALYADDRPEAPAAAIPYRFNRAVLFDAKTLHGTDRFEFADAGPESRRMNLSFSYVAGA